MIVYRLQDAQWGGIYTNGHMLEVGAATEPVPERPMPCDDGVQFNSLAHVFGWHSWQHARNWMLSHDDASNVLRRLTERGVLLHVLRVPPDKVHKGRSQCAYQRNSGKVIARLPCETLLSPDVPDCAS